MSEENPTRLTDSEDAIEPVADKSEQGASSPRAFWFWSYAAVLLFLLGVGYRLGEAYRPVRGYVPSSSVISRVDDLGRMIAMRAGSDLGLGLSGDAFPGTLDGYWKTLNIIATHFYNPTPLAFFTKAGQQILSNHQKFRVQLTYSAIQGVMSSLDDPYSRFMDPSAFKDMQQDNSGSFAGVGAQLIEQNGKLLVVKALPDTPAERAHLMPMDEIVAVNGRRTSQMTADAAVQLIRGRPGTQVALLIHRGHQTFTVNLVRAIITSQHFEYHVMSDGIGYMKLSMFDEEASDNIQHALKVFHQQKVRGLILDLRDDPGGLLNAAVDVASSFIPAGTVVWVQERGGQRNPLNTNPDIHPIGKLPLVVLVNHYSASASEILSGAIKDTHSGTIVGLTTWGKGLVQEVIPLNDNSAIALTTAHYFTPNGSDINLKGVKPDVVVGHNLDMSDANSNAAVEKLVKEQDVMDKLQLDTAVDILRKEMSQRVARS